MDLRPLIDHLEVEIKLYKELITVLQKETEDLVTRDYETLYNTVTRKESLLSQIASLTVKRFEVIEGVASLVGLKGEAKLSEIIERVERIPGVAKVKEFKELKGTTETIVTLLESIKDINKVNKIAVEGSLDNINKTLNFIGSFFNANAYNPSGVSETMDFKGGRLSEGA